MMVQWRFCPLVHVVWCGWCSALVMIVHMPTCVLMTTSKAADWQTVMSLSCQASYSGVKGGAGPISSPPQVPVYSWCMLQQALMVVLEVACQPLCYEHAGDEQLTPCY